MKRFIVIARHAFIAPMLLLAACGGGGGGGGGGAPAPAPVSVAPRFAYVANYDNTVSIFAVDAASGKLRHNGYVTAGTRPSAVAVDPAGRFAFVVNSVSSDISAYTINATTGALTQINCGGGAGCNGASFLAGSAPLSITIDPSGRFAYVANNTNSGSISAYTINAGNGTLARVDCGGGSGCSIGNGADFTAGTYPYSVSVDPSGKFVYVTNDGSDNVSAYRINAATGALTAVTGSPFVAGLRPRALALDPTGKFAYVANNGGSVSAYAVNSSTGALSPVTGSPFVTGAPGLYTVAVDTTGRFVYAGNGGATVETFAFSINASTGALTPLAGSPFTGTGFPNAAIADPSGKFLYTANSESNNISLFGIDANTGALTSMGTVASRASPSSIAMTKGTTPVTYTPKFAYSANWGSNDISAYTINAGSGALTQVNCGGGAACNGANFRAGTTPFSVTVDPAGRFAYVPNQGDSAVSAYRIDATTGVLTQINCGGGAGCNGANFRAGSAPLSITIDPSGRFAYAANNASNFNSAYAIDATTGALTSIGTTNLTLTLDYPYSVTVDPTGRFAYVANSGSADVSAYTINATTGALTQINCGGGAGCNGAKFAAGLYAISVTVDPSGRFAYVANAGSNNVSAYTINGVTGALAAVPGSSTGAVPYAVAVDPAGRFAYVANQGDSTVSAYSIDATTGALTSIGPAVAAGGTGPRSVTIDPSGKTAYVANFDTNNVSTFAIDASTGVLTRVGTAVQAGTQPESITTTGTIQ